MSIKIQNSIASRLSLREPQRKSLEILARLAEIISLTKDAEASQNLAIIRSEYPSVTDFERDFPSLCFSLATGVGKTRLMGAFISYLHLAKGINHFFVLAPNLTIYNKLIADFTPNTPKYVFKGISEFAIEPPLIVTGDNYEDGIAVKRSTQGQTRMDFNSDAIHINIFNISKINSEVRGGKAPRIKRLSEYIGESYFEYLAGLPDLVLLMDESHRYRASAGIKAINELKPILGLELTATPFTEAAKGVISFKNIIYNYPLAKAMEDGFVKEPAVVTQKNFDSSQFSTSELEKIKLEDGIRLHENTKVELETYARQTNQSIVKPFVLVIARDTSHADELQKLIESEAFFEGRYKGKAIQVHSNQSGEEKEEVVSRLLLVEKNDEPTEIVIHVNMLKEGWDVTNLYTIIPLRAANARTLVEQSIGRGLRLPYGKRTGVPTVDQLNIIAHDKFQEIVDEANRSDSPIHLKTIILDPTNDLEPIKTVISQTNLASKISGQDIVLKENVEGNQSQKPEQTLFANEAEKKVAAMVLTTIGQYESLPNSSALLNSEIQEQMQKCVREDFEIFQSGLAGTVEEVDINKVTEKITRMYIQETIDIPRISIIPKNKSATTFKHFKLKCSGINYQPVERALLIQNLRTNEQDEIDLAKGGKSEKRLEDYIVRGLMDLNDISYDDHADLMYDLCSQLIQHFKTYLKSDDEILNILIYHQKQLVKFIHIQMLENQTEESTEYEVFVSKGFTHLKETGNTTFANKPLTDYRKTDFDKTKIGKMLFTGFSKCIYTHSKFGSDTERRFAVILENESLKWFKPLKGQFQIHYHLNHETSEYIPDFVAETKDKIYMIETKAKNQMTTQEVLKKKEAALEWCIKATEHNKKNKGKPWQYLLISHDDIQENKTLQYFEQSNS